MSHISYIPCIIQFFNNFLDFTNKSLFILQTVYYGIYSTISAQNTVQVGLSPKIFPWLRKRDQGNESLYHVLDAVL